MNDELNLPDNVDLGLDKIKTDDILIPHATASTDDFDLDDFLAEKQSDDKSEETLDLGNLFDAENTTEQVVTAPEDTDAHAHEVSDTPDVSETPEVAPDTDIVSEETVAEEPSTVESEETVLSDLNENDVRTTEPVTPSEAAIDEKAFDEANAPTTDETQADVQNDDSLVSESEKVSENEPENIVDNAVENLPENPTNNTTGYDVQELSEFVRWYAGTSVEPVFEVDKNSLSAVLQGDAECKVIHVNVGYDTYGWQVHFAGGVIMSLRDVREYQLRHGHLPADSGSIMYGDAQIEFSAIEKITIYESVRYFTYAANN